MSPYAFVSRACAPPRWALNKNPLPSPHGSNGGSGDGVIDGRDAVFGSLRVWIDANHNGRADAGELVSLDDVNIVRLGLDYRDSRRHDVFGNLLRYWGNAILRDERGREKRVDTCDVFFIIMR